MIPLHRQPCPAYGGGLRIYDRETQLCALGSYCVKAEIS